MTTGYVVLVCGGRAYEDRGNVFRTLDALNETFGPITRIVHGGASRRVGSVVMGADYFAGEWGKARGVEVRVWPADWKRHGRKAGPIRNGQMLIAEQPNIVVAFPGGTGTADMVARSCAGEYVVMEIP